VFKGYTTEPDRFQLLQMNVVKGALRHSSDTVGIDMDEVILLDDDVPVLCDFTNPSDMTCVHVALGNGTRFRVTVYHKPRLLGSFIPTICVPPIRSFKEVIEFDAQTFVNALCDKACALAIEVTKWVCATTFAFELVIVYTRARYLGRRGRGRC